MIIDIFKSYSNDDYYILYEIWPSFIFILTNNHEKKIIRVLKKTSNLLLISSRDNEFE